MCQILLMIKKCCIDNCEGGLKCKFAKLDKRKKYDENDVTQL